MYAIIDCTRPKVKSLHNFTSTGKKFYGLLDAELSQCINSSYLAEEVSVIVTG